MKGSSLAILRSLLSEADFFVDGKDLQTCRRDFPVALFARFSVRYCVYERRLRLAAGAASSASTGGGV